MSDKSKKNNKMNFHIYWRILGYVKRYMKLVVICIILSLFISFLHFGSLGMIKPLGDILFTPEGSHTAMEFLQHWGPWGQSVADLLKEHVFSNPYRALYFVMVAALVMVVVKNIIRFFQEYLSGYITVQVSRDISNDLFQKVERLPIRYFSKEGASQITSRFMNDIPLMSSGLKSLFEKAIREPLKAVGSVALAMILNWRLTLLTFLIFPVIAFALQKLGRKVKRGARKTLTKQSGILAILQETFSGMKIVKAYQMEEELERNFAKENQALVHYQMKVVAADAATNPLMETFVLGAGVGVMIISAHLVLQNKMTTGDFCAFYAALGAIFDPMRKLADINNRINTAIAGGERVFDLMDIVPEVQDSPTAITLPPLQSSIRFEKVSFAYEPDKNVLQDVSFEIKKGEKIAIVGRSGSGKSTLVSLLLRLYDVNEGRILLDGHDIREATSASVRKQMSIVTQEAFLFNDTIAANIVCKSSLLDRQRIEAAAKAAHADLFIEALSQKYDTLYGPGGIDLSGGQKHRIALARAIFKDPEILILDEAMANLDAESEGYILKALENFSHGRTTFIIAHRFSTIEKVDRILVLNEGRLVGFGNHKELIVSNEVYRNLYNLQLGFAAYKND